MEYRTLYALAADAILVAHVLFVVFIVLGLLLVFAGKILSWGWVRNPRLRAAHLLGITVVVLQSWFGVICPLTRWEIALRTKAGGATYEGAFVAHWLSELLYFQAPPWVFVLSYTVFGFLVVLSWFWVRPHAFVEERPSDLS